MFRYVYRNILNKLNLSEDQLRELREHLKPESICIGPFIKEGKMCPNTSALSLKIGSIQNDPRFIRREFGRLRVSSFDLWLFYLLWDIPSFISQRYYENSLETMREVVDGLLN